MDLPLIQSCTTVAVGSLSQCLPLSLCLCLSVSVFVSLYLVSVSLSVSLSLFLSLSFCLSVCTHMCVQVHVACVCTFHQIIWIPGSMALRCSDVCPLRQGQSPNQRESQAGCL